MSAGVQGAVGGISRRTHSHQDLTRVGALEVIIERVKGTVDKLAEQTREQQEKIDKLEKVQAKVTEQKENKEEADDDDLKEHIKKCESTITTMQTDLSTLKNNVIKVCMILALLGLGAGGGSIGALLK